MYVCVWNVEMSVLDTKYISWYRKPKIFPNVLKLINCYFQSILIELGENIMAYDDENIIDFDDHRDNSKVEDDPDDD